MQMQKTLLVLVEFRLYMQYNSIATSHPEATAALIFLVLCDACILCDQSAVAVYVSSIC